MNILILEVFTCSGFSFGVEAKVESMVKANRVVRETRGVSLVSHLGLDNACQQPDSCHAEVRSQDNDQNIDRCEQ